METVNRSPLRPRLTRASGRPATGAVLLLLATAAAAAGAETSTLVDPARMLASAKRIDFLGANAFSVEAGPTGRVLRSTPANSASGLYQRVNRDGRTLATVAWSWRVDRLQTSADIRALPTEDVGATIMFVFGEPSTSNRDVPTIAYAWTATPVASGTILPSLRFKSLRYVQLRGSGDAGRWQREERNVAADYRRIFGREPGQLVYIAVFNDNDQTHEPASALFGRITSPRAPR